MAAVLFLTSVATAGGGPANVLILYNADVVGAGAYDDPHDIAEYYRQLRCIPANRMLGITGLPESSMTPVDVPCIDPDPPAPNQLQTHTICLEQYEEHILEPLDAKLAALGDDGDEIDYLVLIRGLPNRVLLVPDSTYPNRFASMSAMLGIYRTFKTSNSSIELWDQPNDQGPPNHYEAAVANPRAYVGAYHSGDYAVAPTGGELSYLTSNTITWTATQKKSFRRMDTATDSEWTFTGNMFIVSWLDGWSYEHAKLLAERGVDGDEAFPAVGCSQTACDTGFSVPKLVAMKGRQTPRQLRDKEAKFALDKLSSAGFCREYVTPHDAALDQYSMAAYFTGSDILELDPSHPDFDGAAVSGNCFMPGAIASNLTSNGGNPFAFFCDSQCPHSSEWQCAMTRFVDAGVTGVHGTVSEPIATTFPGAGTMLLYTFGYNFAESFFFTQPKVHWQDHYLGDPLTSAYAVRPDVTANKMTSIRYYLPWILTATHSSGIDRIKVYCDGVLLTEVVNPTECDTTMVTNIDVSGISLGVHHMLAVAYSCNGEVTRTGWHEETQLPQPDVQGWLCTNLNITTNVGQGQFP